MWDLIVLVPDHCLSIYFSYTVAGMLSILTIPQSTLVRHVCKGE